MIVGIGIGNGIGIGIGIGLVVLGHRLRHRATTRDVVAAR